MSFQLNFLRRYSFVQELGWAAHIMEQRANNRIIRPSADYIGPESSEWIDIDARS